MIDIFISYASEDRPRAVLIAAALQERGWKVFWDRRIPAGKTWRDYIGAALEEARCVVVVWSAASIASTWVQEEADSGRERGVLVPVLIEAVNPPLGFRLIQAQDLTGWDGDAAAPAFAKLVDDLANMLGVPPAPAAEQAKRDAGEEEKAKKATAVTAETGVKAGTEKAEQKKVEERVQQPGEAPRKPLPGKGLWFGVGGALAVAVLIVLFKGFISAPDLPTPENISPAEKTVSQSQSPAVGVSTTGRQTDVTQQQSHTPPKTFTDSLTAMEFVWVEGGCFQMGVTFGDGEANEKPVHEVCVDGFYMGKYEVTQGQWQKIMGANPSEFKSGDDYPVEQVSWHDTQDFIGKLNAQTGKNFRLPTEAEWEYAARSGGRQEKYSGGDDVDSVAWYRANSGGKNHRVGTKKANGLGLYDMSGNVWEWCSDWYGKNYYASSPQDNPQGPATGSYRVNRGGSWINVAGNVRSAFRFRNAPDYRISDLGFRLVMPPGQ